MLSEPFRIGRSRTGLGLFATVSIGKGAFIAEYSGPRIPTKEALDQERRGANRYIFTINNRWSIDGSVRGNKARYANHSCRPNARSELERGRIVLRATRHIKPGEEITYDYSTDGDGSIRCRCRPGCNTLF